MNLFPERGVAYYGCYRGDQARRDLEVMASGGLNGLLLAVSEFDLQFYHDGLREVVEAGKGLGFRVDVDLWGWGKVFGGEPPSLFLQSHSDCHQVSSQGESLPAACIQSEFRSYFLKGLEKVLDTMDVDGIFLDEPHYYYEARSTKHEARSGWACFCERCRRLFQEEKGNPMGERITDEIVEFREEQLLLFLKEACDLVKGRGKRVTVCLVPVEGEGARHLGILHWEKVASLPIDLLATDPYWIHFGEEREGFIAKWTQRILELCAANQIESQAWVQLFRVPVGREEEIRKGIQLISSLEVAGKKVESLFGWPYLAGKGTDLASENPERVWRVFTESLSSLS